MREQAIGFIFACLTLGAILLSQAIPRYRRIRKVRDTSRSKTSSAPQGFVELQGYAWPQTGWKANSLGRPTVYYSFRLQKEVTNEIEKKKEWLTVFQTSFISPFYLVDHTGLVSLDLRQSDLELKAPRSREWGTLDEATKARVLKDILTDSVEGFPPKEGFLGNLSASIFQISEREILAGSPLYVTGDFRSKSATPVPVVQAGLTQFAQQVFKPQSQAKPIALASSIIGSTKSTGNEKPFELHGSLESTTAHRLFVSDTFEEQMVENLGKFLALQFVGASVLISVGLYVAFLLQFHPEALSIFARIN